MLNLSVVQPDDISLLIEQIDSLDDGHLIGISGEVARRNTSRAEYESAGDNDMAFLQPENYAWGVNIALGWSSRVTGR